MSSAPVRGIVPHRQRRHHHHHHEKHQRHHHCKPNQDIVNNQSQVQQTATSTEKDINESKKDDPEEKRPKINPIFLWAAQCEQRIVEVRCEDYDKRNRIKLTKTAQGWRSIPRTALTAYPAVDPVSEDEGDPQETFLKSSKNEEKENSSSKRIEKVGIDELVDNRTNEIFEGRERHKRKRKKHSNFYKNKKKRTESESEEPTSESVITSSWKMKKRRKLDKNKRRKRLCLEAEVDSKKKIEPLIDIKVKKEAQHETEIVNDVPKTEKIVTKNEYVKKVVNSSENSSSVEDNSKDLEKAQTNRHLQPRVVLEQLHLSQLPTRIHRRLVSRTASENNEEQSEGNNKTHIDEIMAYNGENSSHSNHDSQMESENEEATVDREDLQEILNMLDSNRIPINMDDTKSNLISSSDISRNCTKLGAAMFAVNQKEDNKLKVTSKVCAKSECDFSQSDLINKFGMKETVKPRVGSKSLDKTIERLERSINRKLDGTLHKLCPSECEGNVNDQYIGKLEYEKNEDIDKNRIESSKILNVLRNTPGLSVSLATDSKKHKDFIKAISAVKKRSPTYSRSPDSQTEIVGEEKSPPDVSSFPYQRRLKAGSPVAKSRVESPESTVGFPKYERYPCEEAQEDCEGETCDSQVTDENKVLNIYNETIQRVVYHDSDNHCDDEEKCSKISTRKTLIPVLSKSSEAQAKCSSLSAHHEVDNYNESKIEDFQSQVSPQPSGIPYSVSSSRKSSAYLERLLPSPPCSVSCSEDAKNDLTLKGILSSRKNSNNKKNYANETGIHCDLESSPGDDVSEENHLKECPASDKSVVNDNKQIQPDSILTLGKEKYGDSRNHIRPMSSGDMHSSYSLDYVCPKRPLSAEWTVNQQKLQSNAYFLNNSYLNQTVHTNRYKNHESYVGPTVFLDPASQLRELIKTSGHLIPDPLLVPRDYLPLLAGAPLIEIPKLLASRPELRLPEALTRPELLRDPDLLVISLAHLQHVLDHGEGPTNKVHHSNLPMLIPVNEHVSANHVQEKEEEKDTQLRPKLSCKPIGKLMPAPIDLSNGYKSNSHPPLLRVRSGLLKQESEVSSTANSPDDSQLWHPLFGSQKQRQQQQQQQQEPQQHQASWHKTTLAS